MKRIIRNIVENLLSGTKAGFKAILNFENAIERKKMDHQKSKSTFSAILPALILMVAAFWVSSAVGTEQKNLLTSSKYFYIRGCLRYSESESHVS